MNQEILNKYSIPVPRYTSYPPANFFDESFTSEKYLAAIGKSNDQQPQHISIYIHIPFCYQMCYYCGCNAMMMQNKNIVNNYIDALKKEMRMVLPLLNHNRKISQIHYGGGTPSSLPIDILKELNDIVLSEFECIDNPEIAIECHPGYLNESYWEGLAHARFNRISLGIQDFNETILKTSNRKPSRMPILDIVNILRDNNISVNMDFIYGLPLQTSQSFSETIEQAVKINPDRIVTFSYAHVPWVSPLQKKLEEVGLPTVEDKENIFSVAKQLLTDGGYKSIGLDHFVLPDDELYIAKENQSLHRNFQGYCTRRTTGQVYAFGVTAISQLATAYAQNVKDLNSYIQLVNEGKLPVLRGYTLSDDEQIARNVISTLMCNYSVRWEDIASQMHISTDRVKASLNYNEHKLKEFSDDGIISFDNESITVLPIAAPFVRNVAASLDKLLINSDKKFSKSI